MVIACGHKPLGALAAHGTAARGTSGAHADMDHTVDHGTLRASEWWRAAAALGASFMMGSSFDDPKVPAEPVREPAATPERGVALVIAKPSAHGGADALEPPSPPADEASSQGSALVRHLLGVLSVGAAGLGGVRTEHALAPFPEGIKNWVY